MVGFTFLIWYKWRVIHYGDLVEVSGNYTKNNNKNEKRINNKYGKDFDYQWKKIRFFSVDGMLGKEALVVLTNLSESAHGSKSGRTRLSFALLG